MIKVYSLDGEILDIDIDAFVALNELEDMAGAFAAMEVGDVIRLGGGAAPIFELKREA
jgi:hypothetical protein